MKPKYTCCIVDDEPLARRLLTNYVDKTNQLLLRNTFRSAVEAMEYLKNNEVDLLFLDIRMPHLSGIGFVESQENLPVVIFTTAYEEYAAKAFEIDVIDYLVKPFPLERFQKAVKRFEEYKEFKRQSDSDKTHLMVKTNYGMVRIKHDNILYVEAKGEYMKLVLEDRIPELIYIRMKELEVQLGEEFLRIHKSFLVNKHKIDKLAGNQITVGEQKLKLSRLYKADVLRRLE